MTTATAYRAQTDPTTKTWHIGTPTREHVCLCGVKLVTPADTRPFALKVAAELRHIETSDDLTVATCKGCKRNREYVKATATAEAATAAAAHEASHPAETASRRRRAQSATVSPAEAEAITDAAIQAAASPRARRGRPAASGDPRADRVADAVAALVDGGVLPAEAAALVTPSRPRRQSRADKAHAKQEADRARREALNADAHATVAAIEAALNAGEAAANTVAE